MTEAPSYPMYPALTMMEKRYPPLRYGREPFWRAPITPPSRAVYLPAWNWQSVHQAPAGSEPLTLDVNGAYLAAAGGVKIAHAHLKRTGEFAGLPPAGSLAPGYYQITVPHWGYTGLIVHPLGDSSRIAARSLWVTHATLELLLELSEQGMIGDFGIMDSWTTNARTEFRDWVASLRATRKELLDEIRASHHKGPAPDCSCLPCEQYDAFKQGYSAALSMMLTGEKCATQRPDWAHAVQSNAAASTWRKAWRFTQMEGTLLLGMGDTDEITIAEGDLTKVTAALKPPFRIDMSGVNLGAFKIKHKPRKAPVSNRPAVLDDHDNIGDLF